ncbi:hypothetical protein [Hymenobacter terrenus]|uniref:hypothetical protein n=1 Tax=Hymenobacter terrenus TaxID=1629124 RepID=UPI0012E02DD3|nr:hypothetical protein [Hymenobacter terrenus]
MSTVALIVGDRARLRSDRFLSAMVSRVMKEALMTHRDALHLTNEVVIDSLQRQAVLREASIAVRQLVLKKTTDSLRFPLLDQLTQQQERRYVFLSLCTGFTRTNDNYLRASVANDNPRKASTTIYALVYDKQSQRIVYAQGLTESHEPLDPARMAQHLQRLLNADFGFAQKSAGYPNANPVSESH